MGKKKQEVILINHQHYDMDHGVFGRAHPIDAGHDVPCTRIRHNITVLNTVTNGLRKNREKGDVTFYEKYKKAYIQPHKEGCAKKIAVE